MSVDRQMLLDDFAKAAMQAIITKNKVSFDSKGDDNYIFAAIAVGAYDYAEAMLAERTKRKEQQ